MSDGKGGSMNISRRGLLLGGMGFLGASGIYALQQGRSGSPGPRAPELIGGPADGDANAH